MKQKYNIKINNCKCTAFWEKQVSYFSFKLRKKKSNISKINYLKSLNFNICKIKNNAKWTNFNK